jgi:hypothetical protein
VNLNPFFRWQPLADLRRLAAHKGQRLNKSAFPEALQESKGTSW